MLALTPLSSRRGSHLTDVSTGGAGGAWARSRSGDSGAGRRWGRQGTGEGLASGWPGAWELQGFSGFISISHHKKQKVIAAVYTLENFSPRPSMKPQRVGS